MQATWMSVEATYLWWFWLDCEWLKICGYEFNY